MGESDMYLTKAVTQTAKSYGISALLAFVTLLTVSFFYNCILLYYVGGILFLMPIFAPVVTKWLPKEKIDPDGKAVFISGCDSGFGHLLAQRLDDLGYQVFAGCLFPDGEGAVKLRKSGSSRLHVIPVDVTNDDSVLKAATYVGENLKENALWAVVNNAGINGGCDLHWTNVDIIKRVTEVNTFGVIRVTKAFLSKLKESKGRVVTLASAAGRSAWPGMVPYCLSKGAAISFCEGLRLEMYKWGVQVVIIEPWLYRTPLVSDEGMKKNIRQTWESVPKEAKDLYCENYIDKYLQQALNVIRRHSKNNSGEVVSLIEDGITNLYPEYSYSPGTLESRITFWYLQKLPKPVADLILYHTTIAKEIR